MNAPLADSPATGRGVLLVNLGSPDSPEIADVRKYLNEFLMDKHVIDLPWPLRRMLVSLFVLPTRPARSSEAYKSVWTDQGSPLVSLSQQFTRDVKQQSELPVELAMRYGNPSIREGLEKLAINPEITEILLFPLYPHYAMSSVKTVIERTREILQVIKPSLTLKVHPVFYDHQQYIEALVDSAQPWLKEDYDHLVFSYHGVPERHILKDDNTGQHCLKSSDCCQTASPAHSTCYRHQIFRTTESFVRAASIPEDKYSVSFQSRLGRAKWLEPNTLDVVKNLADQGAKKILVICPSFVADCLETLEEIGMEAKEAFVDAGGKSLELIPCLNTHPGWVKTVTEWIEQPLDP